MRPKDVPRRLADYNAVIREHLVDPCNNVTTSQPEFMTATAPTSNGHAHLERLIEDVQSEAEPQAKPKRRGRRSSAEVAAERAAQAPRQLVVVIDGRKVEGTANDLAELLDAMPASAAA